MEGSRSAVAKNREDPRPIGKENGTRTVDILEAGVSSGLTNRGRDAYEITTVSFLVLRSFLWPVGSSRALPSFIHDKG